MAKSFNYFPDISYLANLDIDDVGNVAIEANDDELNFSYLVTRTSLGKTQIYTFGPIYPDIELFPTKVTSTFERINYDEKKLIKIIKSFLHSKITQARVIDIDECLDSCKSILDYMKNFDVEKRY